VLFPWFLIQVTVDRWGAARHKRTLTPAVTGGAILFDQASDKTAELGGVPEWLKGTGCKPVGYAYVGSNPTSSTIPDVLKNSVNGFRSVKVLILADCGCSSMVEQ
jgi:hypothetical protein